MQALQLDDDVELAGESAYQIARRRGYRYSEPHWLESLRGVDGKTGAPGPRGEPGPPGLPGPQGEPGRDGSNGRDGRDGRNGTDGTPGELPPPEPWTATWERDHSKQVLRIRIRSASGQQWSAEVKRGPDGLVHDVTITPEN